MLKDYVIIYDKLNQDLIKFHKLIFPEYHEQNNVYGTELDDDSEQIFNGVFGKYAQWIVIKDKADNSKIVGCATIGLTPDCVVIYNVGIHPDYRRQGLSKVLMSFIINSFITKKLLLFVEKTNRPAFNLYRQFGFLITEEEMIPPEDELCMVRNILV